MIAHRRRKKTPHVSIGNEAQIRFGENAKKRHGQGEIQKKKERAREK